MIKFILFVVIYNFSFSSSHISESVQKHESDTNDDGLPEQPEDSPSDDGGY